MINGGFAAANRQQQTAENINRPAGTDSTGLPVNSNGWPLVQTPGGYIPMGGPGGGYTVSQSENGVPISQTFLDVPMRGNWNIGQNDWNNLFPGQAFPY